MTNQEPRIRRELERARIATEGLRECEFAAEMHRIARQEALRFLKDHVRPQEIAEYIGLTDTRVHGLIRTLPNLDEE